MALGKVRIAHIVAGVLSAGSLALAAYVASSYYQRSPDVVNFNIFNGAWSLAVLAYIALTPMYMASLFHKLVSLGLLITTCIFWFSGAVAYATFLGHPMCGTNTYCGAAQAGVAVAFFAFASFAFLTILDTLDVMRSRGHKTEGDKTDNTATA